MQVVEDGDRFLWGYFNAEAQQSTCHDSGTSMATVAMDVYRLVAVFQNVPKRWNGDVFGFTVVKGQKWHTQSLPI